MHGKLATINLAANTDTIVYTAPATCVMAEVTLHLSNRSGAATGINVAVSPTPLAPAASEWIESGVSISAGGVYTNERIMMSPGETIVVRSSQANVTVRVMGSEKTKI